MKFNTNNHESKFTQVLSSSKRHTQGIQFLTILISTVHNQRYQRILTLWPTSATSDQLSSPTCLFETLPKKEPSLNYKTKSVYETLQTPLRNDKS